jgi:TatD DNase family protein
MWCDSHAHLFELSQEEFQEQLYRSEKLGVTKVLNLGTDIKTSHIVVNQPTQNRSSVNLYSAVGVGAPDALSVNSFSQLRLDILELVKNESVVAIGEIGIDSINESYPPFSKQRELFEFQIELAVELDLPLSIHSRGCEELALEICIEKNVKRAVFHCFTGSAEAAKKITNASYYISYSGIITFKNSDFDEQIKAVPSDKILIETDSPYLAPVPNRGKQNEPAFVANIGEYVANVLELSCREFGSIVSSNFDNLFLSHIKTVSVL